VLILILVIAAVLESLQGFIRTNLFDFSKINNNNNNIAF